MWWAKILIFHRTNICYVKTCRLSPSTVFAWHSFFLNVIPQEFCEGFFFFKLCTKSTLNWMSVLTVYCRRSLWEFVFADLHQFGLSSWIKQIHFRGQRSRSLSPQIFWAQNLKNTLSVFVQIWHKPGLEGEQIRCWKPKVIATLHVVTLPLTNHPTTQASPALDLPLYSHCLAIVCLMEEYSKGSNSSLTCRLLPFVFILLQKH